MSPVRISRRDMISATGALAAGLALGCSDPAPAPRGDDDDFSIEGLVGRIGRATRDAARALTTDARARGIPHERLLAAAWMAPLRHGGLRGDVHALLALPAIDYLARASTALGLDPWPSIAWGLASTTEWCSDMRVTALVPARAASASSMIDAIRRGDQDAAESQLRGLVDRVGTDGSLHALVSEALEPREDVHASIYAAQLCRFWGHLAPAHRADASAHLARYLARSPRVDLPIDPIETVPGDASAARDVAATLAGDPRAPLPGVTESAVLDALVIIVTQTRLDDPTPSGVGVHQTTLLDAVAHLARRSTSDRARALGCAVRSVVRSPIGLTRELSEPALSTASARSAHPRTFDRDVCRRMIAHASDEHAFKYWAALHTLAETTTPALRSELWSGLSMLPAARLDPASPR